MSLEIFLVNLSAHSQLVKCRRRKRLIAALQLAFVAFPVYKVLPGISLFFRCS